MDSIALSPPTSPKRPMSTRRAGSRVTGTLRGWWSYIRIILWVFWGVPFICLFVWWLLLQGCASPLSRGYLESFCVGSFSKVQATVPWYMDLCTSDESSEVSLSPQIKNIMTGSIQIQHLIDEAFRQQLELSWLWPSIIPDRAIDTLSKLYHTLIDTLVMCYML